MSYRSFLPWIVFAAVSSIAWQWAALAAFAIGLRVLIQHRKEGIPDDALILEFSTCAYYAVLTVVAFALPHSDLKHYCAALGYGWLAATMASTLAVHRPFTLGIARRKAPREVWNSPSFLRMNTVITTVWAVSFAVAAIAIALFVAANASIAAPITCQVLGFAIPAVFTHRYPTIVRNRLAAAPNAGAAAAL
jgi:hypothetical protein